MTIFWRIFLCFWVATACLLAIIFSQGHWPVHRQSPSADTAAMSALSLKCAVDHYEQGGPAAFRAEVQHNPELSRSILLFDTDGYVLAPKGKTASPWSGLVKQAVANQTPEFTRAGIRIGFASPLDSSSGRHYVVVFTKVEPLQTRFHRLRFWMKLVIAMIPATLICLGLAIYITRPLSKLRSTARRLSSGDLSARPPEAQRQRRDEVGELTRDIDVMATRIEELMAAQRRFVADVAHELGAPLTRMQLAHTLLRRRVETLPQENLDQIEREADRLSHLVQELLFLASLERGAIPAEAFVPTSLSTLCGEIIRDNAAEVEEKACEVSVMFNDVQVLAAPQALRRAIENVFRNAVRHTPSGSVIRFSCEMSERRGFARVVVRDAGTGISEEMLSAVFQPFVRAPGQSDMLDGTGLGLAIASEAIALHGGEIWAANATDRGLIVTVELPL